MTPPSVLLDDSFLAALFDPSHESAGVAHERYAELVSQYEGHEIRLRARHDHLGQTPPGARRSFLAPVETVYVAGQHRRAAKRLELPFEAEPDEAVTLVIMRREQITRIASFRPVFELLDVTVTR